MSIQTTSAVGSIGTVYGTLLNDKKTLERRQADFAEAPYKGAPKAPVLYIKPRNTHACEGAQVAVPAEPSQVRIDGTVGVVIGRRASRVSANNALEHVAGYVIVSDLTLPHDNYYRPSIKFRARDGFCPMSSLLPAQDFELAQAELVISVNGTEVARRGFTSLLRPVPQLIADVTEFMTLSEGDVLLVGPPDEAPLAQAGDTVRLEVLGLGQLSHSLVAEKKSEIA